MKKSAVVEVDFAELSDGSLVEMIEDPADATKTRLAVWRNKSVRYTESVVDQGKILVPLPRADDQLQHVRLARGAEAYGQFEELEQNVACFFNSCLDLEFQWQLLLAAFVISSWSPEKLPVAPYLALVGPPGSGKTTAMRVLNLLCYRGLLTADISSSAFYEISHRIRPTILLDETLTAGRPRELIHLLKASSTPDCCSLRKGKARLAFGPKVFSWLELPDDPALNSRCIIVPMQKTSRTDLTNPNSPKVLEYAKRVRMRLLQFRFERFRDVSVPEIPADVPLSGRPLDLYRALALPFYQDRDMCGCLGYLIAKQNQLQPRLSSPAQASTIRILYNFIHKYQSAAGFTLSDLTAAVNSDLASRGESAGLNERKFGDILTSLSFTNRTRKNTGYVLWLDRSDRARIHATARDYGIEGTKNPIEKCEICAQTSTPSPISGPPEAQTGEARSEGSKSERRERREHRSRGARRRVRASERLHFPRS